MAATIRAATAAEGSPRLAEDLITAPLGLMVASLPARCEFAVGLAS
jgi:hypothetical protein